METSLRMVRWMSVVCLLALAPGCWFVSNKKYQAEARRAAEAEGQRDALAQENAGLRGQVDDLRAQKTVVEAKPAAIDKELEKLYQQLADLAKGSEGVTWDERGHKLSFADVLFDFARADLRKDGEAAIAKVASALKAQSPNILVRVDGHTDNVPVVRAETKSKFIDLWGLSAARALAVLWALEKNGVPNDRLFFRGFADQRPVASNQTAEGRQANRRVEISFVTRYEAAAMAE